MKYIHKTNSGMPHNKHVYMISTPKGWLCVGSDVANDYLGTAVGEMDGLYNPKYETASKIPLEMFKNEECMHHLPYVVIELLLMEEE